MYTKKIVLLLSLLYYSNPCIAMEKPTTSWFSPSYYTNLIYQTYQTGIDKIKNTWQQGMPKKAAIFKWSTAKNWPKKYEKHAEDTAEESAELFKKAIESAAKKADSADPKGIMARFKNHPEKFLFGASSSSYQFEGGLDKHNANANFYNEKQLPSAGNAIDFWNKYKRDIPQMKKELGINCFRLSIAWDRVEPEKGNYNQEAITTYVDIVKTLKNNNIEPIIVLHHYTIPLWFEQAGGFEKEENIDHFVTFAKTMYNALYQYVTYWSTFNAIEGYAFKGYYTLDGPPGKTKNLLLVQQVMHNMLKSHVDIYQAIKHKTNGLYYKVLQQNKSIPNPQIGIQKNIIQFDKSQDSSICQNIAGTINCTSAATLNDKGFFLFFNYGRYYGINRRNTQAPTSIDWIGVNTYSNMIFQGFKKLTEEDKDKQTANLSYRDYPEGIYRAVETVNYWLATPLNIPIIITENGIATDDNNKRTRFFQRALYTIRKLIEEGYPIIGYTPWASHDNYEWPTQEQPDAFTSRRYGFFEVNFDKTSPNYLKRTLKPGAYYYRNFIRNYFLPTPHYKPINPEKE